MTQIPTINQHQPRNQSLLRSTCPLSREQVQLSQPRRDNRSGAKPAQQSQQLSFQMLPSLLLLQPKIFIGLTWSWSLTAAVILR